MKKKYSEFLSRFLICITYFIAKNLVFISNREAEYMFYF